MALCPFAAKMLLPESHTQPGIVPRIAILHSAASRGSLYNFFRNSSNLESHFWVSEAGRIEQYVDTNVRADANLDANGFAISIETESSPSATERWAPAQAAALVRLLDWICDEHRMPRRLTPTWDGSGIGYHIQFGAPGPWTPVAKSCPGPARIVQARNEIIPAVAAYATQPAPGELTVSDITAILAKIAETKAIAVKAEKMAREAKAYAKAGAFYGRTAEQQTSIQNDAGGFAKQDK